MQGFKPGSMPAHKQKGGKIKGPGSGTSDSIKADIPKGSYIMPADSTQQIGPQALGELGEPVPVNLSNGEYQMPPEQVHAVGVQALNQMRDATHTPAPAGFKPQKDGLYFADGGSPAEEERRRTGPSPQMGAVALGNQARVERSGGEGMYEGANSEIARGFRAAFPSTDTAIRGASQNIYDAYQAGGIPAAIGATVRNTAVPALGFAADVGRGVKTLIDPTANALKTAVTGDPTPIEGTRPAAGVSAQPRPQPATSVAADPQRQADDPVRAPTAAAPQGFSPSALTEQQRNEAGDAYRSAWQREAPAGMRGANDQALGLYNAEQQVRGSNITARRGENGVMEFSGSGEGALPQNYTKGVDMALGNERMARANAIRAGNAEIRDQIGFNSGASLARQKTQDEIVRDLLTGQSRSGRQVAAQIIFNKQNEAQNAQRIALDERRVGIDQQRAETEANVRGFEARALERAEKLYQQLENAKTPEERAAIAEQLRALSGKEAPNRFTVVPGGQEFDPAANMVLNRPAMVLNNQTGQPVDLRGVQSLPPIAENPAVQEIMQNTKLSREERAAQIRALGYR